VTSPSAPRPGFVPPEPLSHAAEPDEAGRTRCEPPAGAISLAELIAESGPLPADAALECVQRIAERLTVLTDWHGGDLGPSDVLIDDDGDVWLRDGPESEPRSQPRDPSRKEMDHLGRLLAFLSTGNGAHLAMDADVDASLLPPPVSVVAARIFSRNGTCYRNYVELARDAAALRGTVPTLEPKATTVEAARETEPLPPEPLPPEPLPPEPLSPESLLPEEDAASAVTEKPASSDELSDELTEHERRQSEALSTPAESGGGGWLAAGVALAVAAGAAVGYLLWQML
jgi:hypothetical protein